MFLPWGAGAWAGPGIEAGSSPASYVLELCWVVLYTLSDACNWEKMKWQEMFSDGLRKLVFHEGKKRKPQEPLRKAMF